jgi:hypothetical protein
MKRIYIFVIPLITLSICYLLHAESIPVGSNKLEQNQSNLKKSRVVVQDSLKAAKSSDYAILHYRFSYMQLFEAGRHPSLSMIMESNKMTSGNGNFDTGVRSRKLSKFNPTAEDLYLERYRTGGFYSPLIINKSSSYLDHDIINSYEYQKGRMYPYEHTPTDFYEP